MSRNWYYRVLGEEFGPVSFDTVGELAQKGLLSPNDEVRDGERGPWVAAESIVGLFQEPEEIHDLSELEDHMDESSERPPEDHSAESTLLEELLSGAKQPKQSAPNSDDEPRGANQHTPAGTQSDKTAIDNEWYFQVAGRDVGPVTLSQLVLLAESGKLSADDLVRQTSNGDWILAEQVDQLSAAVMFGATSGKSSPRSSGPRPTASEDDDFELSEPLLEAPLPESEQPPVPLPQQKPREPAVARAGDKHRAPPDADVREKQAVVSGTTEAAARGENVDKGWYYRWEGDDFGPFRYGELKTMARSQRISPDTEVKRGKKGQWVQAASCKGLFESTGSGAVSAQKQTAASSTNSQADPANKQDEPAGDRKEKRGWFRRAAKKDAPAAAAAAKSPSQAVGKPSKTAARLAKDLAKSSRAAAAAKSRKAGKSSPSSGMNLSWIEDLVGVLFAAAGKLKWVAIAAAVVVGVMWATPGLFGFFRSEMAYYETLNSIYTEHKQLRESGASDTEWSQFTTRVNTELGPLVEGLKASAADEDAGASKPLYYAALRVPKMLESARKKPSPAEESFAKFLQEAEVQLAGPASAETTSANPEQPGAQ